MEGVIRETNLRGVDPGSPQDVAALGSVRGGTMQVALILNATRLQDIITIAENNERMPRKSTHFYPKPPSGLVFFPMGTWSRDSDA